MAHFTLRSLTLVGVLLLAGCGLPDQIDETVGWSGEVHVLGEVAGPQGLVDLALAHAHVQQGVHGSLQVFIRHEEFANA